MWPFNSACTSLLHRKGSCQRSPSYSAPTVGIFQGVRFYPILNFGLCWAPLFSRCFYSIMNFGHFWADPIFSAVRITFLAEEKAKNLEFLHHPKFWPFLGRPLKDVLEFSNFWAGFVATHSVHCLLCLTTTKEDKQKSPCFLVKTSPAEGRRRFHQKTRLMNV